jgi:hypothetical protein
MRKSRLALRAAAAAVSVLSVTAMTTAPASADEGWCQPGYFCMWGDMNFRGRFLALHGDSGVEKANFGDWYNDLMTSYWNRSNRIYLVFEHADYQGACTWADPGEKVSRVPQKWQNDSATSARPFDRERDKRLFCQG